MLEEMKNSTTSNARETQLATTSPTVHVSSPSVSSASFLSSVSSISSSSSFAAVEVSQRDSKETSAGLALIAAEKLRISRLASLEQPTPHQNLISCWTRYCCRRPSDLSYEAICVLEPPKYEYKDYQVLPLQPKHSTNDEGEQKEYFSYYQIQPKNFPVESKFEDFQEINVLPTQNTRDKRTSVGWKFHISIHYNDVPKAWGLIKEIILKYQLSCGVKFTSIQQAYDDFRGGSGGREITIYASQLGSDFEWKPVLDEIQNALDEGKIRPCPSYPDTSQAGRALATHQLSGYKHFSYRCDKIPLEH